MTTTNVLESGEAVARLAQSWAPRLKALADENRLALALLLAQERASVKQLQERSGLSQALVSHHLRVLRDQGLVTIEVQGRSNVYSLCCGEVQGFVTSLSIIGEGRC